MKTLAFVVPAHGRHAIAEVCFKQLRRTCDALAGRGIVADAVVVACDENLELAQANNFATIERDNRQLGSRINDGYQLAGEHGAHYLAPCGNDDWIHPDWVTLPSSPREIVCTHLSAVVNETGTRLARLNITYQGGDGIRIFPRLMLAQVGFRPAAEDRNRAIDTATNNALSRAGQIQYVYHDTHPLAIVDFKSPDNLNDYDGCRRLFGRRHGESLNPWDDLAEFYPADAIREMRAVYSRELAAA